MIATFTGASGTGKTSVAKRILAQVPRATFVTSFTTRSRRPSDLPGEYTYLSDPEFEKMNATGQFVWTAQVGDARYGTSVDSLTLALSVDHKIGLMIIVPERMPNVLAFATERNLQRQLKPFFFLSPPLEVLRTRMTQRGDDEASIASRLEICRSWETIARSSHVPYIFIADHGGVDTKVDDVLGFLLK